MTQAKTLSKLTGDLADELYRTQGYELAYNPTLKLYGRPGESERDFRVRCDQVAREQRDAEVDKLKTKYEAQLDRIQDKLAREQGDLAEAKSTYKGRQTEEVISGLETVAGMFGLFGRRKKSLSSAATKRRMASTAKANVAESEADIARLQAQVEDVKSQMEQDADALTEQWTSAAADIQVDQDRAEKDRHRRADGGAGLDAELGSDLRGQPRPLAHRRRAGVSGGSASIGVSTPFRSDARPFTGIGRLALWFIEWLLGRPPGSWLTSSVLKFSYSLHTCAENPLTPLPIGVQCTRVHNSKTKSRFLAVLARSDSLLS